MCVAVDKRKCLYIVLVILFVALVLINTSFRFGGYHTQELDQGLQPNYKHIAPESRFLQIQGEDMFRKGEMTLGQFCGDNLYNKSLLNYKNQRSPNFPKVHLLIVINTPIWRVVPLVDSLYRPFFPNITFCSMDSNRDHRKEMEKRGHHIVTYTRPMFSWLEPGALFDSCWIKLYESKFLQDDYDGVLMISDDQIIFPGSLEKLNPGYIWKNTRSEQIFDLRTGKKCQGGTCDQDKFWVWFHGKQKQNAYRHSMADLQKAAEEGREPFNSCYKQLVKRTGAPMRIYGGHTTDMSYVPRKYMKTFVTLLKIFVKDLAYVEMATATVLACIDDAKHRKSLVGTDIYGKRREKPWIYFNEIKNDKNHNFFHPVKWSNLMVGPRTAWYNSFLCTEILPTLHPVEK